MDDLRSIMNDPVIWAIAAALVALVVMQAFLFIRLALRFSGRFSILSDKEKSVVYKTATINSIGPAVAIFIIAISLISIVGAPITLMRIGVIGSAVFELYAAGNGAKAAGADIAGDMTLQAFTAAVWAMCLGGAGWLVSTMFFTWQLGKAQGKLRKSSPQALLIMGAITPTVIFFVLMMNEILDKKPATPLIGIDKLAAAATAAISMVVFRQLGKVAPWLKEWGLGFSLLLGVIAGYLVSVYMMQGMQE
ncbi:uncharacterized protein DUF5058 [Rhodovulum bhavnagarense]|uniref:Uncharacterized protein DUF5058 n=1 Tax=Rhodovulum bhavnagarense TaxID=992286 RepID=A0A4R2RFH7_9RHOB|nr:DUF5058 family protein [Rhodovulum bhavnagarense]TCP61069.1 uncharacterized protein DUF5058 [Rhodovulum bhavnagarense]